VSLIDLVRKIGPRIEESLEVMKGVVDERKYENVDFEFKVMRMGLDAYGSVQRHQSGVRETQKPKVKLFTKKRFDRKPQWLVYTMAM
jgi:hypothetical protein